MEGEGMVAVVQGLRDSGLAVTLMDGRRQYTLLPTTTIQPLCNRGNVSNSNASTQQSAPKTTTDSSTEPTSVQCDRDSQAIDGRYTSTYKSAHCNVRPTSPPVQLTEFPPQRPELYPGQGNFQVGGLGSGASYSPIRATSPVSFRGGLSWPDRGSVCTPRQSREPDAFANSLRKYPNLSPDRSTEVIERLINYSQAKALSKSFTRNQSSPTRLPEPTLHHFLESKSTYTRNPRYCEQEVNRPRKVEEPPTRDKKKDDQDLRFMRNFDVRHLRDMSKRARENAKNYSTCPYTHPICPTIRECHDFRPYQNEQHTHSSNSVNMEIQAAVKMISKEAATVKNERFTRKTVAVPESPTSSAGEDNAEGDCFFVPKLEINTSFKSIQTTFCPSDETLKPRKSAQTISSTIEFNSKNRSKHVVGRKTKSQEQIKLTKDDLKRSLLELIEEVSHSNKSKKIIRDELIKKLFETDRSDRYETVNRRNSRNEKCNKYVSTFCPTGCDYVGDFQELVGKLKHCYGDTKQILHAEVKQLKMSEYRQLDFVLKDWVNNLHLRTREVGNYIDRVDVLSSVEDKIKELFKNRTKQSFDLKSEIVNILDGIPIDVTKTYNRKVYLHKLVDVLLKRMRNVVLSQQNDRIRRKTPVNKKKILTEEDIRNFVRGNLLDFFNQCHLEICDEILHEMENEMIDIMIDSLDCIRCGHVDDASDEMKIILQDYGRFTCKQANYITDVMLQDLQEMLNNCNFNQSYMILHSDIKNNSEQTANTTNDTDFSIGAITETDLNANLDQYINNLCQRINEWLDTLNLPQIRDKGFRDVVVTDLAGDIVDRHKYLELNSHLRGTDQDELETLKYQIFKWINKLVGEENQETVGHANELQRMISQVPKPMLTNPQRKKVNISEEGGQTQPPDPMKPCLGETGPNTCHEQNLKIIADRYKKPCCVNPTTEACCGKPSCTNMRKEVQDQAKQDTPESISPATQNTKADLGSQSKPDTGQRTTGDVGFNPATAQASKGDQSRSVRLQVQESPVTNLTNEFLNSYMPPGSYGLALQNVQGRDNVDMLKSLNNQDYSAAQPIYGKGSGFAGITGRGGPGEMTGPSGHGMTRQGGPAGMTGQGGPVGMTGLGPTTGITGLGSAAGMPGTSGPVRRTGQGGPVGMTGHGPPTGMTRQGGPVGLTSQDGPAGMTGQGGPVGMTGQGRPTGMTSQGGPAGMTGQGGPTGMTSQGVPAGITGQGVPAGMTGQGGPAGMTGQGGPVVMSGQRPPTGMTGQGGPVGMTGQGDPVGMTGQGGPVGITGQGGPVGMSPQGGPVGMTPQGGPVGMTPQGGPAGMTGQGRTTGMTDQGRTTGMTDQGSPAGMTGQGGPVGMTGQGGPAGMTSQGGPAGMTSQRGPAGMTHQGGSAGMTGQGGPVGMTGQGGPAGMTSQGGPAGMTSQRGPAGMTHQGGSAGMTGQGGPAGMTSQGGPAGMTPQGGPAGMTHQGGSAGMTGQGGSAGMTGQGRTTGMTGLGGAAGMPGTSGPVRMTGQSDPVGMTSQGGPAGITGQDGPVGMSGPMPMYQQPMYDSNSGAASYGPRPGNMMGGLHGAQIKTFIGPMTPEQMGGYFSPPGPRSMAGAPHGAQTTTTTGALTLSNFSPLGPVSVLRGLQGAHTTTFTGPMAPEETQTVDNLSPSGPGSMVGRPLGVQTTTFRGPMGPEQTGGYFSPSGATPEASYYSSRQMTSPTRYQEASAQLSLGQLNEEYDDYLKLWVQQIPMKASTPAEQQLAEKARINIYNGIWKAITKMKLDTDVFNNPYRYQDVFDEEIEALLKHLPKSEDLEADKPILKAQLLEKTVAMNDFIKSTKAPASFKQQLIEKIENNLPRYSQTGNDSSQQNEELQKHNIADSYILYTRYKHEDSVKATVHKRNFLMKLEEFLNTIKKKHGIDMDTNAHANEIINSLDKVPIPNQHAIKAEAEDILLGIEVEHWISDLPINPDNTGPSEKKRVKDSIVKKIQELGTTVSYDDDSFTRVLKTEVLKYLEKLPIQEETNTDFMMEELANRIKNFSKNVQQKSVSFQDTTLDYGEFSRNMPASSSLREQESPYIAAAGNVIRDGDPNNWLNQSGSPEEKWHSLETTLAPPNLKNWSTGPQNQSQPNSQNISGQIYAPGSYPSDTRFKNGVPVLSMVPGTIGAQGPAFPDMQSVQLTSKDRCCPNVECTNRTRSSGTYSQSAGPQSQIIQGFHGQGSPALFNQSQSVGPAAMPFGQFPQSAQGGSVPVGTQAALLSQGPLAESDPFQYNQLTQGFPGKGTANSHRTSFPYNQVGRDPIIDQGISSITGSPVPHSHVGSNGQGIFGVGPQGQDISYIQGSSIPYNQVTAGPHGQGISSVQGSTGKGSPVSFRQATQRSNGLGLSSVQDSAIPYNQGTTFSSSPYGQDSPNVQASSGSRYPNVAQRLNGQGSRPYGQAVVASNGKGISIAQGSPDSYSQGTQGPQRQDVSSAQGGQILYDQGKTYSSSPYGQDSPNFQGSSGGKYANSAQTSQLPHKSNAEGSPAPYSQVTQGPQGHQTPYSQGQMFSSSPYGLDAPNVQGSLAGQYADATQTGNLPHGHGSPTSYNQGHSYGPTFGKGPQNTQDRLIPVVQVGPQRHHKGLPSPVGQRPYGLGFQNIQGSQDPYSQIQSIGPVSYGQAAPGVDSSSIPMYHVPSQGVSALHEGQVSQRFNSQGVSSVQGPGNLQDSAPFSQAPYGQVSPIVPSTQVTPNVQGGQDPYSQVQNLGPVTYLQAAPGVDNSSMPMYHEPLQGVNASHEGQVSQIPKNQDMSNVQGPANLQGLAPFRQAPYGQMSPNVPGAQVTPNVQDVQIPASQMPYQDLNAGQMSDPFVQHGHYVRISPNTQSKPTPGGQMSSNATNVDQMSQFPPESYGQASTKVQSTPADQNAPGHASTQVQSSEASKKQNQTAQSFGPISAASQAPDPNSDILQKNNVQEMAGGGLGVLGTSQEPGSSAQASPTSRFQPPPISGAQPSSTSGAQPSATTETQKSPAAATHTPQTDFDKYADSLKQDQATADQPSERLCIPSNCIGLPPCLYSPQQMNRGCPKTKRARDLRHGLNGVQKKSETDDTDTSTEKERDRCRCMRRFRRCRGRRPAGENEYQLIRCDPRTVPKEIQHTKDHKTTEIKQFDINKKEIFNIKSVQTAFSSIDIKTTKCKYCEIRSKSQEELTKVMKMQEVIKRKDLGRGDLQDDVTEWFEIHSDNVKVKLWGDKMKKLAEKLKKPGGEEKLRLKIEKYLKHVPDQFSEGDDEGLEFKKQLPDNIIKKLKKLYRNPIESNVNVYRMELPKYGSRFRIETFRIVVMNWVKTLNIKKKDFLGRTVKKEDVFKFVTDRLEPLVLDKPVSDFEYKTALRKHITDIIDDLPLLVSNDNKEFYMNKVTEALVDDIFNIEGKFLSKYIQPTNQEIKEFVKDEITFFLEKSRVAISTKRTEHLETELIDILLDLTDIEDIDNEVEEDITNIFKDIAKLPEYKAKYFTNLLLRDYKEFFFRESFFQEKGKSDHGRPDVYSVFQNANGILDFNSATRYDYYTQQLVEEINKWLSKIDIPNKDKNFIDVVVKDLASDIVDRQKYLTFKSEAKATDSQEFEQLKYQIFKWTNKLVGEENKEVLEHAPELMNRINTIPKPSFVPGSSNNQCTLPQDVDINSDTKSYIDKVTYEIYDWFYKLPRQVSQDVTLNKQLVKNFAEVISNNLNKKNEGVMEREVVKWSENVFKKTLNKCYLEQLTKRVRSLPHKEEYSESDPKQEKILVRFYEDLVDDWIDTVPIDPKNEGIFIKNRYEYIHELGVKICKLKTRNYHLSPEEVEKKLREEITDWMKKLPLHPHVVKQNSRDKYADKVVKNIQAYNFDHSKQNPPLQTKKESDAEPLKLAILEWVKKLPSNQSKSFQNKRNQEAIMTQLANKLSVAINDGKSDLDTHIIEHIRILDPKNNDAVVLNTALQLKRYLQEHNMLIDIQHQDPVEDFFDGNIKVWLNNLPLNITDGNRFNIQKRDFIESMKRLKSSGSDNVVIKKEILTFLKSLPLERCKKEDKKYLEEVACKLIQTLMAVPAKDISRKPPLKRSVAISEAIKEWTNNLPLKYVHNPELRLFIDDMSSVITMLLLHPENSKKKENDPRLLREIIKFLRRFPLQHEFSTENHISNMAEELAKTLKNVHLYREDDVRANNVTVYGVSINTTDNDFTIESIQESDVNANLEVYTKQLIRHIGEWFDNLNLPEVKKETFKEVVINDLAGDIVDRHKYLELNPDSTVTKEGELEHLKYQIFKWINKLVGEENTETIANADNLMQRIQTIPVPMLVRPQDKSQSISLNVSQKNQSKSVSSRNKIGTEQQVNSISTVSSPAGKGSDKESLTPPLPTTTSDPESTSSPATIATTSRKTQQNINILDDAAATTTTLKTPQQSDRPTAVATANTPTSTIPLGSKSPAAATSTNTPTTTPQLTTNPVTVANDTETKCCSRDLPPPPPPPKEGTKEAIYDKYQKIFKDKCNALPIDTSTPENAQLAELARVGMYNGIVKTFFKLKSDPEIENDYGYFEFMLEDKIEEMLDVLPQTQEFIDKRHAWKLDILSNAIEMLDQLHNFSDRPSFRQRVRNKFNRKFAHELELEECFLLQQGFLAEMADAYILETNYKEKDPIKVNIYKNRLIKKIDDLTNHLSKEHNVGFRFFKKAQLARIAMKVLEQVPIPDDHILQEEAEEIQLADEIEKWYKELPTKPLINDTDGILRKRMMDLLAKKLYDIKNHVKDQDPTKEEQMKHEVSQFLEKRGKLQQGQDLNINFMVDELNNRLKNRWLQEPADYKAFERDKPLSSTFAQVDNKEFLAPLMDATTSTDPGYQDHFGQAYDSQSGQPGQMSSFNGGSVNVTHGGPSQGYASIPVSGPASYNATQEYISHQESPGLMGSQRPVLYENGTSQFGPNEGYGSQQNPATSKVGPKSNMSQQSQPRSNLSQGRTSQSGRSYGPQVNGFQVIPGQIYVTQNPAMTNSQKNGRTSLLNSQVAPSPRLQNINQHLSQHLDSSQMGQGYDQNNVPYGGPPGQIQFVPTQGLSAPDFPGYLGPTVGSGAPASAPVGTGVPDEDLEMMDSDYQLRCRCLDAYRRRRRCFEYDERCRVRPYCPY